jgi:hypothetical protein
VSPSREPMASDAYAVRLALTFTKWVHRNVERFEIVDADTVCRQMSVDFTLPEQEGLVIGQTVAVPLMVPRKGLLRGLDVTDAKGHSLNVLESAEGQAVALGGLKRFLEGLAGAELPELPMLEAILSREPEEARKLVKDALKGDGEIGEILGERTDMAVQALVALVEELADGFLLMVALPYQPGTPSLVKVSYETQFEEPAQEESWLRRATRLGYRLPSRLLGSLGLMGRVEYFKALRVRHGRSYHVEVLPAAGTYSGEAFLTIEGSEQEPESRLGSREDAPATGVWRDTNPSRPHLWVGGGGHKTNRGERGQVGVILYARRDGLIFPLFFSAAVIAGVLAFVPTQDGSLDGITLGALLLAPVALAAYYARSDENGYLTMALRGVRGLATLSVIAGVTVIGLLALGYIQPAPAGGGAVSPSNPTAIEIARWAARAALICADVLGLALVAPTLSAMARRAMGHRVEGPQQAGSPKVSALALAAVPPLILIVVGVGLACGLFALLPI